MSRFLLVLASLSSLSMASGGHLIPNLVPTGEAVLVKEIVTVENLMPVIGPEPRRDRTDMVVEVVSTGCTREADFKVEVKQLPTYQTLRVVRTQPDYCETTPHPVKVNLTTTDLVAHKTVKMLNPLYVVVETVH